MPAPSSRATASPLPGAPSARATRPSGSARRATRAAFLANIGSVPDSGRRTTCSAGPRQLADLGARVAKAERVDGGDFARGYDTAERPRPVARVTTVMPAQGSGCWSTG